MGSGGDALRVVRATRDQLGVAWSAELDPLSWRVVCWDSGDAAVARLTLSGSHRRATFAGLARLRQPFTIAVSGLGADGSVLWQVGSPISLCAQIAQLDASAPPSARERAGSEVGIAREGGGGGTKAAEEGCGAGQDRQDEEAEAEEEDCAREVATAPVTPRRSTPAYRRGE